MTHNLLTVALFLAWSWPIFAVLVIEPRLNEED